MDDTARTAFLAAVRRLSAIALAPTEPRAVREALVGALFDLPGIDQVHMLAAEPGGAVLEAVRYERGDLTPRPYPPALGLGADLVERAVQTEQALVFKDLTTASVLPAGPRPFVLGACVLLPLAAPGAVKEAVVVGTKRPYDFSDDEVVAALTLVDLAGAALALLDAQAAARTDALTGCLNHGAMHARLREEISRVTRNPSALSVLLVDLDDFKAVNDSHGHVVGDLVLQRVAHALSEEGRPYDVVARYGGDEFFVIMPGANLGAAVAKAQRLRRLVVETGERLEPLHRAVTVSIGVAEWQEGESGLELLERADRALLEVKRSGKDGASTAAPGPDGRRNGHRTARRAR